MKTLSAAAHSWMTNAPTILLIADVDVSNVYTKASKQVTADVSECFDDNVVNKTPSALKIISYH